jgi:hypothetical protein
VAHLGVDEKSFTRGNHYFTMVTYFSAVSGGAFIRGGDLRGLGCYESSVKSLL